MITKRQVNVFLAVFWIFCACGPVSPAFAACSSVLPSAGETVTCTGLNDAAVVVQNDGVIIDVLAGAELNNATTTTTQPLRIVGGTGTTVNNSGLIQATSGSASLFALGGPLTIVNDGTIAIATTALAPIALSVTSGGDFSLTNTATGLISASGTTNSPTALRYQTSGLSSFLLNNAGQITSDMDAVTLDLRSGNTDLVGSITNSGTISGLTQALRIDYRIGSSLVFNNSGSIDSGADYGVEIQGTEIGTINLINSGSITGEGGLLASTSNLATDAVALQFTNAASGNIVSNSNAGAGVRLTNFGSGSTDVSNAGAISASGNSSRGLQLVAGSGATTISNSGTIQADGFGADGILYNATGTTIINVTSTGEVLSTGDFSTALTIINSGSTSNHDITLNLDGLVEGLGSSATGLAITESATGVWNVINTGTIRGDSAVNLTDIQASAVLDNSGTIESTAGAAGLAISIQGAGQIINSGSITGRVLLGDGGSFELLEGGTINGTIASDTGIGSFLHSYGATDSSLEGSELRGFESITKEGGGRLSLTGSLSTVGGAFPAVGDFDLNDGSLHLTDAGGGLPTSLSANLTIADIATLSGAGNIFGNVLAFGRISPGSSTGRFFIDGDLSLTATSSLIIEFFGFDTGGDPLVDFLSITGTADIAGNLTLEIPDDLTGDFNFVFLEADGGVSGLFDDVTLRDNATATVEFSPNEIAVNLQASENVPDPSDPPPDPSDPPPDPDDPPPDPDDPPPGPVTPPIGAPPGDGDSNVSQRYVAAASNSSGDLMDAHQALIGARLGRTGVNSCGPSSFAPTDTWSDTWSAQAAMSGAAVADTGSACDRSETDNELSNGFGAVLGFVTAAASRRLDTGDLFAATQDLFAMNASQGSKTIASADSWTAYMSGGYGSGKSTGSENLAGYDYDIANLAAGIDHFVAENITVGVGMGWGLVDGDYKGGGSHETESFTGSAYAAWVSPVGWYANGVFSYAGTTFDQLRPADPDDLLSGILESDADGRAVALSGVFGRDITLGRHVMGANLGLSYVDTRVDGYTETLPGDDVVQNVVGSQNHDSLRSSLGLRYGHFFQPRWGILLPQLRAAWVHDFKDNAKSIGTDVLFDPPDRDFFNVGASLLFVRSSGLVAGINYDAKVGSSDSKQQTASLSVRWRF